MTSTPTRPQVADAAPALAPASPWSTQRFRRDLALLVTAVWVLLDHATKELAVRTLSPAGSERIEFPGFFSFELTYNDGGAWSVPLPSWFFLTVTVIVTVVVLRALRDVPDVQQALAYGLLLSGALGNALDRVFRTGDPGDPRFGHGHVVDFIASARFPTFNVADIAITVGFVLLVWAAYRYDQEAQAAEDDR